MTIFYRKLYKYLLSWKNSVNRKPLIIRGARQVGKSTLVHEISARNSGILLELNLEKSQDKRFFDRLDNASDIINSVFLSKGIPFYKKANFDFY